MRFRAGGLLIFLFLRSSHPFRRTKARGLGVGVLLLGLLGALAGCAARQEPTVLEPLRQQQRRNPVILIPGVTGSQLRDVDSGKIVWGRGRNVFLPRDGGYRFVRPLTETSDWRDDVEPFAALTELQVFGIVRVDVYASLMRLMEANGYQIGDLADPQPEDTFFVFPYDLRYGNVESAAILAERLERLRQVRGGGELSVSFICHSNAAQIARYYAKYGAAPLELAERGEALRHPEIHVDKMILVSTANGGAINCLRDIHRGKIYVPWFGRRIRPEVLFTFRSLYGALPVYREDVLYDLEGNALDVDLFDAENWRRFGWSVFDPQVAKRIDKPRNRERFGDEGTRMAFLRRMLDHARRLHAVLLQDAPGFGDARVYLIHGVNSATPDGAVMVLREGGWDTYFLDDPIVAKNEELMRLVATQGDGIATLSSQEWLSRQERAAIVSSVDTIPTYHRKVIKHPEAHSSILEFLVDDDAPVGIQYARRGIAHRR